MFPIRSSRGRRSLIPVLNSGKRVTIETYAGNDTIRINEAEVSSKIYHNVIDAGKDIIFGFKDTSTLKIIGAAKYTHKVSGNDVIITVGTGSVTLKKAKNLNLNFDAENIYVVAWQLDETKAIYGSTDNSQLITVDGVKAVSGLQVSASTITLKNSALNFYASGDGNDVIADFAEDDKIKITKGNEQTYWFTADDKNYSSETQLSSLLKDSSAAYPLATNNLASLNKNTTLLTYSGKK